ncbi:acetylajmaline esterase [Ranunculus cassubicifolius]
MPKLFLTIFFFLCFTQLHNRVLCCYTSIFSFGDSLADTGNLKSSKHSEDYYDHYPYGETFFGKPTGRCSDGRLVIDFIAEALGLPLMPPYLGQTNPDFSQGMNFAVAGATALDVEILEGKGVKIPTNLSLGVQIQWFKQLLPTFCNSPTNCRNFFLTTLLLVGEIGGNDYNYPFFQGKDLQEIHSIVPDVIKTISMTIKDLIEEGAVTLVVPGNLPIGCSAAYLTQFKTDNKDAYDPLTGCLNWLNEFSQYHNQLLQNELNRLREMYPHVRIIYADYYNAAMELYQSPKELGFTNTITACCGGGGPYNYNVSAYCTYEGSNLCSDVSSYVSWDGIHLTEKAYRLIANGILKGPYAIPRIDMSCKSDI